MDGLLMEWGNHIGTGPGSQMGELSMMPIGQVLQKSARDQAQI